ncbi:MAG: DUF1036 domain-containing protein [Alphaproteobacteria bacterium]|jgi:uncharacterized membrane protein|nr:DUF1036 domain-containing protein [Alphaproteobacteria bacterium]
MVLERWFRNAVCIAIAATALLAGRAHAQPEQGWRLCNQTSYVIEAAIARPEGQGIVVEGWTKLRPGACNFAIAGTLTPGLHFLYGRSSSAHRGGARHWGGDQKLCVDPSGSFSVENPPDCSSYGLEQRRFRPVLIERRSRWQTTFTETNEYSLEKAEAAGVQRLLEDAGVFSGRVDGLLGRKTRAAISEFLSMNDLPADTSDADLIDLLEQAATEQAREIGFTLCNRTDNRIWSAIARRRGEDWESRGWWQLEAGGCARAIDEPLVQTDYFVYAEMEVGDGRVRTLKRASDSFCVARPKFAITGRQDCEAAAYRTARFTATPAPQDEKLVFEFFERDFDRARTPADG